MTKKKQVSSSKPNYGLSTLEAGIHILQELIRDQFWTLTATRCPDSTKEKKDTEAMYARIEAAVFHYRKRDRSTVLMQTVHIILHELMDGEMEWRLTPSTGNIITTELMYLRIRKVLVDMDSPLSNKTHRKKAMRITRNG